MSENKGANDPRFNDARELLKQEGLVLSVNNLKKLLGIGDARAKAILEALQPFIVHTKADDSDLLGGDSSESPSDTNSGDVGEGKEAKTEGLDEAGLSSEEGAAPVTPVNPSEPASPAKDASVDAAKTDVNLGAGSGPVKERVCIGEHPVTGLPVYEDEI